MCMQMHFSRREVVVIGTLAVVFSPIILVGALGYGAVVGAGAVGHEAKDFFERHNGKRIRNRFRALGKRLREKLGRDTLDKHVAAVTAQINAANPAATTLNRLYLQRASLLYLMANYNAALQDLTVYLGEDPKHLAARVMQGHILGQMDDFDGAEAAFKAALPSAADGVPQDVAVEGDPDVKAPTTIYKTDVLLDLAANRLRQALIQDPYVSDMTTALLNQAQEYLDQAQFDDTYSEAWRCHFMKAVCAFSLYCQREKENPTTYLDQADKFLSDPSCKYRAEALSLRSQVARLHNSPDEADYYASQAVTQDPDVFLADKNDRNALLAPWPMPSLRPDGAKVHQHHEWQPKAFHRATWCHHCGKFVLNSMLRSDAECKRCGVRVHAECKDLAKEKCTEKAKK